METINVKTLKELLSANALIGATVVGVSGGWIIKFKYGMTKKVLVSYRNKKEPKLFKGWNTVVDTLKEYGIIQFEVNTIHYASSLGNQQKRPDLTKLLTEAHKTKME